MDVSPIRRAMIAGVKKTANGQRSVLARRSALSAMQSIHTLEHFTMCGKTHSVCNECYTNLKGEKEAVAHAKQTGHQNFAQK